MKPEAHHMVRYALEVSRTAEADPTKHSVISLRLAEFVLILARENETLRAAATAMIGSFDAPMAEFADSVYAARERLKHAMGLGTDATIEARLRHGA